MRAESFLPARDVSDKSEKSRAGRMLVWLFTRTTKGTALEE